MRLAHLAALVALMVSQAAFADSRACESSDMCSVGTTTEWVGDIRESSQLRAMLANIAYKRELIITIYSDRLPIENFSWTDQVLQLHGELMRMGYAHHVLVSLGEEHCKEMTARGISCVWDSSNLPETVLSGETALWHNRWKLLARAVRLGYNVMSVDTDFMFFQDPYVHFKRPPLADIQMFCNVEGGSAFDCNGGFIYVQNARPDGPVAWVFMETVRSSLRRGDDGFKFLSQWTNTTRNCLTFDQAIISDALCTAAVGRPVLPNAVRACKQTATFKTTAGTQLTFDQARENVDALVDWRGRSWTAKSPPEQAWLEAAGFKALPESDQEHLMANLTVPNLAYGMPEELGGSTWSVSDHAPLSSEWEAMLRADCPDCPWWPEERPIDEDPLDRVLGAGFDTPQKLPENLPLWADPDIPTETMAHTPRWLSCSLSPMRRGVVLGPAAPRQGYIVMGHVHYWSIQTTRRFHKGAFRKLFGRYNWTLGAEVAAASGHHSSYLMRGHADRVLALSPALDLSRTRTWAEFASIMAGLFQVAHLSRRVVVLPHIPCQAAWLHTPGALEDEARRRSLCVPPLFYGDEIFSEPYALPVAVDAQGQLVGASAQQQRRRELLQVEPTPGTARRQVSEAHPLLGDDWWAQQRYVAFLPALWDLPCVHTLHGLVSPEFHQWVAQRQQQQQAGGPALEASDANTVLRPAPDQPGLQLQPPSPPDGDAAAVPAGEVVLPSPTLGWSLRDVQAAVPAADVAAALHALADQPVVYLGHPVMVVQGSEGDAGTVVSSGASSAGDPYASLPLRHPNEVLRHANHVILSSRCRAVWDRPGQDGQVVSLDQAPLKARVRQDGQIELDA